MELVVARIDELRPRLTESFEAWARLRQGFGAAGPASCALSGGATAMIFLGALRNADVDWSQISLFWTDERAVPADDPESNYGVAERMLLGPLGAKAPRAFPMALDFAQAKSSGEKPGVGSLGTAAMKYDTLLAREVKNSLDLALLGVGEDGHICSLFPGHRALMADDLRVVAIEDAPKPPPRRLTLSLPFVLRTKKIWLIAVGPRKLPVLHAALSRTQRATPLDLLLHQAKDVTVFTDQIIRRA
jgi:6-phosphogluconolactonase